MTDSHEDDETQGPETKVYPDRIEPRKVTYEGYVEGGEIELPPIDDDGEE